MHAIWSRQSYRGARAWYGKAVKLGYAPSQLSYAEMDLTGKGVQKDVAEGLRLVRLAADQGYSRAQNKLAYCYSSGDGVTLSPKVALTWWLKAAKQSDLDGQYNLAALLSRLNGECPTPVAIFWYRMAAAQGCPTSAQVVAEFDQFCARACTYCGSVGVGKRRCSRCRSAYYCSAECQRSHWTKGAGIKGHSAFCCDKNRDIKDFEPSDFDVYFTCATTIGYLQ